MIFHIRPESGEIKSYAIDMFIFGREGVQPQNTLFIEKEVPILDLFSWIYTSMIFRGSNLFVKWRPTLRFFL
jgi:hypothetical protein